MLWTETQRRDRLFRWEVESIVPSDPITGAANLSCSFASSKSIPFSRMDKRTSRLLHRCSRFHSWVTWALSIENSPCPICA
jgi:hypothetical protein